MVKALTILLAIAMLGSSAMAAQLNEIRIDMPSTDTDEYFELAGNPGESLDGLWYLVIGDGATELGSGVIENATDLTGFAIQADGVLCIREEAETPIADCADYDAALPLNFENSDNVTHLLVSNFTGAEGDDVDVDDDGILDNPPWDATLDCVALIETPGEGDLVYCDTQVGPDGTFVPGHVFLCEPGWFIGLFDLCANDSPGYPNDAECEAVPTEDSTWSGVKGLYR